MEIFKLTNREMDIIITVLENEIERHRGHEFSHEEPIVNWVEELNELLEKTLNEKYDRLVAENMKEESQKVIIDKNSNEISQKNKDFA